jgi:hypothetical protein
VKAARIERTSLGAETVAELAAEPRVDALADLERDVA